MTAPPSWSLGSVTPNTGSAATSTSRPRARHRSLRASPWARVIKASDFTDNAVGIIHTTAPRLARHARKYGPLVPALRELILRQDTPQEADVTDMIADRFDAARAGSS